MFTRGNPWPFRTAIKGETLVGAKTLVVTDKMVQWLNPAGVSRPVTLPAEASSTNLMFIILNTGTVATFNLVLKNAAATTIATLGPGMSGMFSCDGTNWKWANNEGIYYDSASGVTNMRNVAGGVAGLDSVGNLLVPFNTIYLTRAGDAVMYIYERLSGEMIIRFRRDNANDFSARLNSAGALSTIQLANMKNAVNGIAGLDASTKLEQAQMPNLEIHTQMPQTLTGAGAVDIVSAITHLVTAGVGDAITLANGAEGQVKTILTKVETTAGDTSVLTPASFANGSTITFDAPGDIAQLLFTNGAWHYTGGFGSVIG